MITSKMEIDSPCTHCNVPTASNRKVWQKTVKRRPRTITRFWMTLIAIFTILSTVKGQPDNANQPSYERPECDNPQLDNQQRGMFLDGHNERRARLARGEMESNGNRTLRTDKHRKANGYHSLAPAAANMYRMRYSCDAESYAQQHANSCRKFVLPENGRPGYKMNNYIYRNPLATPTAAALAAMADWWSQLARYGMRSDMLFTDEIRHRENLRITKWSKMAWWNNNLVGCAMRHCGKFYNVVCMYRPGGNDVGRKVYQIGQVCSECPETCIDGLCQ